MGDRTSIEWTEATWNPLRARTKSTGRRGWHCEIVSPGCEACDAETMNARLGTQKRYLRANRELVDVYLDERILTLPLRWKRPRRIVVCDMSDLFGEWVPDEWIDRIFAVMALCPQHQFLVLTKRHERMREYMSGFTARGMIPRRIIVAADTLLPRYDIREISFTFPAWPLSNVWLGVSVEDQPRAVERIPVLLDTPAAVRWANGLLLGPIDLCVLHTGPLQATDALCGYKQFGTWTKDSSRLNWVVIGGESGPRARPFNIEWARSIIRQCKAAGVACFVKQLGAHPIIEDTSPFDGGFPQGTFFGNRTGIRELNGREILLRDRKGGDPLEWAEDLRVREYPAQELA